MKATDESWKELHKFFKYSINMPYSLQQILETNF